MRKFLTIILVLIGFVAKAQIPAPVGYLMQPAKWKMTNPLWLYQGAWIDNLSVYTGDTVLAWNPYTKRITYKIIAAASTPTLQQVTTAGATTNVESTFSNGLKANSGGGGLTFKSYDATFGGIWSSNVVPSTSNHAFITDGAYTFLAGTTEATIEIGTAPKLTATSSGVTINSLSSGNSTDSIVVANSSGLLKKRPASVFTYTAGRGLTLNSNVFRLDTTKAYTWTANNTFSTSLTTPLVIGGTAVGDGITYKATTGVGTSTVYSHTFTGGNNGATTLMKIRNDGLTQFINKMVLSKTVSTGGTFELIAGVDGGMSEILASYWGSQPDLLIHTYDGGNQLFLHKSGNVTIGSATSVSKFAVPIAPTASANYGLVSRGSGNFTGAGVQPFAGAAGGTVDAINTAANTAANFADWQHKGIKKFAVDSTGTQTFEYTNTATATTGNQTINKTSGQVNIAAAGTTVTVTNNRVTANSIVMAVIMTDDATATLRNVVVSAGSFVINIVACTAETRIGFFVINR